MTSFSNNVAPIAENVNREISSDGTRAPLSEARTDAEKYAAEETIPSQIDFDDIVVASTGWNRDGGLKHPRADNFVDFDHGTTLIMSGDAKYIAEVVVGITNSGEAAFYDVVDMPLTEK